MPNPLLAIALTLLSAQVDAVPPTIEEYLQLEKLNAVQLAPDGGRVAFVATAADLAENRYRSDLYLWDAEAGARVVSEGRNARLPRWSADGAWLAFLAPGTPRENSEEDTQRSMDDAARSVSRLQIWALRTSSGAAFQLSDLTNGVTDFGWAPDGTIYAMTRNAAGEAFEFHRLTVPAGEAEFIWGADRGIREMSVSPDGAAIAFSSNASGDPDDWSHDIWILDLESRRVRKLTDRAGSEFAPVWSADSRGIVFKAPKEPRYTRSQTELFAVPAAGGALRPLTDSFDRTVIEHRWPPGGDLLFTAPLGAYTHIFAVRETGSIEARSEGNFNHGSFDAGTVGSAIYAVRESGAEAAELWRITDSGAERLTRLNAAVDGWAKGRQEMIRWRSPDGLSIEGLLVYPADYEPGFRYPLLVNPHPGARSRARDVYHGAAAHQLLAARGYAVLVPNYRGSIGYGERIASAARVDHAGGDYEDVISGVGHVISIGVADPERMAIYGFDYAGNLAQWAITQTRRFKAALSLYGLAEPGDHGAQAEGGFGTGLPREVLEEDPLRPSHRLARDVRTPLLIIQSDGAAHASASSANHMYAELSRRGFDVRRLSYPVTAGERLEPRERIDLHHRQLRWFDRYLKYGGADVAEYYLPGEPSPNRRGWRLRLTRLSRIEHTDTLSGTTRYLEITLAIEPDSAALATQTLRSLSLDAIQQARLANRRGTTYTPVVAADALREARPLADRDATLEVTLPNENPPASTVLTLAFEIPDEPDEYRLHLADFTPIRFWSPSTRAR